MTIYHDRQRMLLWITYFISLVVTTIYLVDNPENGSRALVIFIAGFFITLYIHTQVENLTEVNRR